MAEINLPAAAGKPIKRVPVKKSTRVDLTPMVDLGFLLITFFVFTTTLSKATTMQVNLPKEQDGANDLLCESCVLNVSLLGNDSLRYYHGTDLAHAQATSYEGIRAILQQKKAAVKALRGSSNQMVLIIHPTAAASFKNFVDMADEVAINAVQRYYIADEAETVPSPNVH